MVCRQFVLQPNHEGSDCLGYVDLFEPVDFHCCEVDPSSCVQCKTNRYLPDSGSALAQCIRCSKVCAQRTIFDFDEWPRSLFDDMQTCIAWNASHRVSRRRSINHSFLSPGKSSPLVSSQMSSFGNNTISWSPESFWIEPKGDSR